MDKTSKILVKYLMYTFILEELQKSKENRQSENDIFKNFSAHR